MKSKQKRVRRPREIVNGWMELSIDSRADEECIFINVEDWINLKGAKRMRDWLSAAIAWAEHKKSEEKT